MKKLLPFIFLFLTACPITPIEKVDPVLPHATPAVKDSMHCVPAQANLIKLGCISKDQPFVKKTGQSFSQFCIETQENGIFLNPICLSQITSCDQMDCCTQTKKCNSGN